MNFSLNLFELNAPQRAAVQHGTGPLLVLAGAGSGKTRVIIYRIARLLLDGIPPDRILAVTFTNKAAKQMRERLARLAGPSAKDVQLSTFHALGLKILQKEHEAAGLRRNFSIYDTADLLSLVRDLCRATSVADRRLDPQRLLELLQAAKRARLQEVPLLWGDDYEMAAYDLYPRYLEQMHAYGAIDFDDLILRAQDVLMLPEVRARWAKRFAYVMVDEYQDTSPDQLALLQALVGEQANICAVGDDDQAIYAWRGAAVDNILRFAEHFKGTSEIMLEQNYRSTPGILHAANAVIGHNKARKGKVLWSDLRPGEAVEVVACASCEDEAAFVAEIVHKLLFNGANLSDIAVLFRANTQARLLEETLRAERVATRVVGGQSLFERKELRDLLAFLSLADNPSDEVALRRVINVPPRALGPVALQTLADHAQQQGTSLWQAVLHADAVEGLAPQAKRGAAQLAQAIDQAGTAFRAAAPDAVGKVADDMVEALGLLAAIDNANDAASVHQRRRENLAAGLRSLARFATRHGDSIKGRLLPAFLRAQALRHDDEEEVEATGEVTLMTLHAAKGLEFPYVLLVGLEEDLLPHRRAIEDTGPNAATSMDEERRLCYVGMTRARKQLWLCHAKQRRKHGRMAERTPSRFLQELPKDGITWRERDGAADTGERTASEEKAAANFFAKMRLQLGIED